MKELIIYIKALRKDISCIFIVAITSLLIIDFWLVDIPELFSGGKKLGSIIEKLCLSYISAFIFYFLVVHIKQQTDKKNIYSYIAIKSNLIIAYGQAIGRDLAKFSNVTLKGTYPDKNELLEICSKINPYSETNLLLYMGGPSANWFQYFENNRYETFEAINDIYTKMTFLDTKLVKHIVEIENSNFFPFAKALANFPIQAKNTNLLNFYSTILEHINTIEKFQEYYLKNIKHYSD